MLYRKSKSALAQVAFLKVQLGDIVTDMRGKSGGMVYQKGRYGLIKRTKVTPVNPQSTSQQDNRAIMASNSSAWRNLTDEERQSWIDGASKFPYSDIFGNRQTLSGNSLFTKLNNVLKSNGHGVVNSCPAPVEVPIASIGAVSASASGGTLSVAFTNTPVPADFDLIVEATPQRSAGAYFAKSSYKKLAILPDGTTSPQALGGDYTAMFGDLVEGQRIDIRIYLASQITGQKGIATSTSILVGA